MNYFVTRNLTRIVVAIVIAGMAFGIGVIFGRVGPTRQTAPAVPSTGSDATSPSEQEQKPDLSVLAKAAEVKTIIDRFFVGEVDETAMGDAVAEGMIKGTGDRWSYYISAADYDSYMEGMNNAYVGIGITIKLENEDDPGFTITDVTPGGPADESGIQPGDLLMAVEGANAVELGMDETRNRVRGEEDTDVTITFRRDGKDFTLPITRRSIAVVNVTEELLDNAIGYITIGNFDSNCARDTIAAIESLQKQGAEKFIFDVRFNPGGMKDELVKLLDYLLPEGPLFISEDYTGRVETDESDAACVDFDMVVLVNDDSYSAAEFFAAALREYEVATVIGTQTCGKGYFQTTIPLSDGSAMALSVGKYRTPKGVSLAEIGGLVPDQVIELTDEDYVELYYKRLTHEDDEQLQAAIQTLTK